MKKMRKKITTSFKKALAQKRWQEAGAKARKKVGSLSHKETVAMNLHKLGGVEGMRTADYSVDAKTVKSLFKKGYLDKHGVTAKGKALQDTFDMETPMR